MNKKDYKAIAEIIKRDLNCTQITGTNSEHREFCYKCNFTLNLADYFKSEDINCMKKLDEKADLGRDKSMFLAFNRKQFILDCGVKQ